MKTDRLYLALVALFGLAVACLSLSAVHVLMDDFIPFGLRCCDWDLGTTRLSLAWLGRSIIMMILLAGAGVTARRVWKTQRFVCKLRSASAATPPARLAGLSASLGLSDQITVLATEVPLAFCFGLLKPRICLSTGLINVLTDKELTAVLLHEDYHRHHYDPLRNLVTEILGCLLFFLPIAAELRDLFSAWTELAADRYAARVTGRRPLAGALHKMLTHPLAVSFSSVSGLSHLSATKARIAELLGDRPPSLRISAHSLLTSSVILLLGCMLFPIFLF